MPKQTSKRPTMFERFYAIVRRIPRGRVATYWQVAALAGFPRHARHVGYALNALSTGTRVPWHRVINAQGRISQRSSYGDESRQRRRLEEEAIVVEDDRISLPQYQWNPRMNSHLPSSV